MELNDLLHDCAMNWKRHDLIHCHNVISSGAINVDINRKVQRLSIQQFYNRSQVKVNNELSKPFAACSLKTFE